MSDLKITVDQLKNYLGTGLILKTDFKTISGNEVRDPFFTMDAVDLHYSFQVWTYDREFCKQFGFKGKGFPAYQTKPVCFKLSDLDKEIEHNGERFVPIEKIKGVDGEYSIIQDSDGEIYFDDNCSLGIFEVTRCYTLVKKLFEWHFWPFGDEYFEKGLVIDKRKITENNSKNT